MFFQKCQEVIARDAIARYGIVNKLTEHVAQGGLPAAGLLRPDQQARGIVEDPIRHGVCVHGPECRYSCFILTDDQRTSEPCE